MTDEENQRLKTQNERIEIVQGILGKIRDINERLLSGEIESAATLLNAREESITAAIATLEASKLQLATQLATFAQQFLTNLGK